MVRMAARYGHFALEELRSAVESISRLGVPGTWGMSAEVLVLTEAKKWLLR
jgi:hypothetical protein